MPGRNEIDALRDAFSFEKDHQKRIVKAERILSIIAKEHVQPATLTCLEIGTGSGVMSRVFAGAFKQFTSVDVNDLRLSKDDTIDFRLLSGDSLPFADESFDVIISAHVLQYIESKEEHLAETSRVLKPGGIVYFSTSNKYALIEPHFNLPLLGYLPRPLASKSLQLFGRADVYRMHSQSYGSLLSTLQPFFQIRDITLVLVKQCDEYDFTDVASVRYASWLPQWLLSALERTIMTNWIFLLRKRV